MKKIQEDHKEIASGKKKDDEGYMARLELDSIERAIKKALHQEPLSLNKICRRTKTKPLLNNVCIKNCMQLTVTK